MTQEIKHSDPNSPGTTKDANDLGVPMAPATPGAKPHQGPEDAADSNAGNRGDYSKCTGAPGEPMSYTGEVIPEDERTPGGPTTRMVPQFPRAV
jgi:hypothetical protein